MSVSFTIPNRKFQPTIRPVLTIVYASYRCRNPTYVVPMHHLLWENHCLISSVLIDRTSCWSRLVERNSSTWRDLNDNSFVNYHDGIELRRKQGSGLDILTTMLAKVRGEAHHRAIPEETISMTSTCLFSIVIATSL